MPTRSRPKPITRPARKVRRNATPAERAQIIEAHCRLFTAKVNALLADDELPGDAGLWGLETGNTFDNWRTTVTDTHARATLRRFKLKS